MPRRVILVCLSLSLACAGLRAPTGVLQITTIAHASLVGFQDLLRATCDPAAPPLTPIPACTADSAAWGLTTEKFRTISALLERAYLLERDVAIALRTLQPGQPLPPAFLSLVNVIDSAGQLLAQLPLSPRVQSLLSSLTATWVILRELAARYGVPALESTWPSRPVSLTASSVSSTS